MYDRSYIVSICDFFFCKQSTAYDMRISDWSSDVCSSDLDQRLMRHHPRDKARAFGLFGVHHPAGEAHFHRLRLADRAGEALRAAHAGGDAELDFGLAELRLVRCDDEIGHHREFAAAAQREAVHRGDPRLANLLHEVARPFREEILRSEEHTSELQSLMRISYAVFCLNK